MKHLDILPETNRTAKALENRPGPTPQDERMIRSGKQAPFSGANLLLVLGSVNLGDTWVFPKIMVHPNHPFVHRVFH